MKITQPKEIIIDTRYASQKMDNVPVGYWIDKSVGNCGLSYLAIKDTRNSIILAPVNFLISNKVSQKKKYPNLFPVQMGVSVKDVNNYVEECESMNIPFKIIITYNSFALGKLDSLLYSNKDLCIYVDESQHLMNFAEQEPKLIPELHKRLEDNINRVTFFSAHPPKREYLPEYIQEMPSIKYYWKHQVKATPYTINTAQPYVVLNKILSDLLTNGVAKVDELVFKKAIVFVNSVDGIKKIIEPLNSPDKIAYVVGDLVRNDSKLNELAFRLQDCENLPLITIGTTSMISGADLYDNETMNIVVSTSKKEFTLFDKELDIPQAITRQRSDENPNNNKFIFILDKANMEDRIIKLEETFNKDMLKLTKVVDNLNYLKNGGKDTSVGFEMYDGFYYMKNNEFVVNIETMMARKYVFEQLYKQYEEGYNVLCTEKPKEVLVDMSEFRSKSYSDFAAEIIYTEDVSEIVTLLNKIPNKNWKDYLTYGVEKNNVLINVSEAKSFYESRTDFDGISLAIRKSFTNNTTYTLTEVKNRLQSVYNNKGLRRTAKATDISEFFEVKFTTGRVDNKITKVVKIICFK